MIRWFCAAGVAGVLLILGGGCGSDGPSLKTTQIKGEVTLDGKPLKDGTVTLINPVGMPPDTFEVKEGHFEGKAKISSMRVEIRAFKPPLPSETPIPEESKPGPVNYLPARYNRETALKAEVTDKGLNPSTFAVTSE
jgi:hypothetical protein